MVRWLIPVVLRFSRQRVWLQNLRPLIRRAARADDPGQTRIDHSFRLTPYAHWATWCEVAKHLARSLQGQSVVRLSQCDLVEDSGDPSIRVGQFIHRRKILGCIPDDIEAFNTHTVDHCRNKGLTLLILFCFGVEAKEFAQ